MKQKEVKYNELTGHINEVIDTLIGSLGQYISNYKFVKVGITGREPQERFNEHLQEIAWDEMIVVYKTISHEYCNEIEKRLVAKKFDFLTNERAGGGSELSKDGFNYVYFLLRDQK
jgi:hypothetical protein